MDCPARPMNHGDCPSVRPNQLYVIDCDENYQVLHFSSIFTINSASVVIHERGVFICFNHNADIFSWIQHKSSYVFRVLSIVRRTRVFLRVSVSNMFYREVSKCSTLVILFQSIFKNLLVGLCPSVLQRKFSGTRCSRNFDVAWCSPNIFSCDQIWSKARSNFIRHINQLHEDVYLKDYPALAVINWLECAQQRQFIKPKARAASLWYIPLRFRPEGASPGSVVCSEKCVYNIHYADPFRVISTNEFFPLLGRKGWKQS